MNDIKYLYDEMTEINESNRGFITMMLNRENGDVWNDYFVSESDYKIYADNCIIAVPINSIIDSLLDHIPSKAEIVEAIELWVSEQIESWNK